MHHYRIRKALWRSVWHIELMGHTEGDWTWIASFDSLERARRYMEPVAPPFKQPSEADIIERLLKAVAIKAVDDQTKFKTELDRELGGL
jgi:hypothetical protein